MAPADLAALLPSVVTIAAAAGEAILEVYEAPGTVDVDHKSDDSPLTAADLASHRLIVDALTELTPDIAVMSEESASVPFSERSSWNQYWLVDPLDGTKEFIKRNGEFTVNIALVDGHRPVLGVVVVPVTSTVYWGHVGFGAAKASIDDTTATQAITVASRSAHPPRVVGSRSHAGPRVEAFLAALGEHELVSIGSSIKLCLVAEGAADVYPRLGPTSEWDTAAAQAVVEAAGGAVVDTSGEPLRCNTDESVLNPEFVVIGPTDIDWLAYVPAASDS